MRSPTYRFCSVQTSILCAAIACLVTFLSTPGDLMGQEDSESDSPYANFVEPDFPFITTTVHAKQLGPSHPADNLTVRGLALQLGNDVYACFDPDLLRMAVGWEGDFVSLTTMAQVSYHRAKYKQNDIPTVLGDDIFGTGIYPGWMGDSLQFEDPRQPGPNPGDVGRGPLPAEYGRWNGAYVVDQKAVLSYSVRGADIYEQPGSVRIDDEVGITRTFRIDRVPESLSLVVAEISNGRSAGVADRRVVVEHGAVPSRVTAVGLTESPTQVELEVVDDRYVTIQIPEGTSDVAFTTVVWQGERDQLDRFEEMIDEPVEMVDFRDGGPAHWPETVTTRGKVSPDTSAFVLDELTLPIPNPWKRNARPADVAFFPDGRAAVVTFAGDVWMLTGLDDDLQQLQWKRFASGLYEPLTLTVVDGTIHVYGREGIVRLHDLNGDNEADYYENFTNQPIQSTETREFPLDMVARPDGGFYLAMGGALNAGPKTAAPIMSGFRAGSAHNGSVIEVSADGQHAEVYASGFRQPYIGLDTQTGTVTASDQQGNFVPSTPIYVVRKGEYYGVPATAHRAGPLPDPMPPLTWIPHFSDDSGASQRLIASGRMGPLNGELVHFSYGRPGLYRVYGDLEADVPQGGVVPIPGPFKIPTIKGGINPADGQLYMAGFQIYGSRAEQLKGLTRLRYTGQPTTLPSEMRAGRQGVVVHFDRPLDRRTALQTDNYTVKRWNYRRTEQYGSGHFKPDGTSGEEGLPVAAVHLSTDRQAVLLVLPDMRKVDQMQVDYSLQMNDGRAFENTLYLTVNHVENLNLEAEGFSSVDWRGAVERVAAEGVGDSPTRTVEASARRGRHLYQEIGCVGCHSVDGTVEGKFGPTFRGLFGSQRTFEDGSTQRADEEYIRESILNPGEKRVAGFDEGMPSYQGILSETDVESIILYIKSLSE